MRRLGYPNTSKYSRVWQNYRVFNHTFDGSIHPQNLVKVIILTRASVRLVGLYLRGMSQPCVRCTSAVHARCRREWELAAKDAELYVRDCKNLRIVLQLQFKNCTSGMFGSDGGMSEQKEYRMHENWVAEGAAVISSVVPNRDLDHAWPCPPFSGSARNQP
jgi:hypothetical protein